MAKRRWYFPSKEADVIPWIKNFVAVLPSPPANEKELTRFESSTRSPLVLHFREEDCGKTVYMAGRWKGRGQSAGPWSVITSAVIP